MMKSLGKDLEKNAVFVVIGCLLLGYMLYQYNSSSGASVAPSNVTEAKAAPVTSSAPASPPAASSNNTPQDLLPSDGNSEWGEFAPHGQGDLMGSGSLLHPSISQRPFNSVQGANALRGDPQISIGDIPTIAAPSNPVQGNASGLN